MSQAELFFYQQLAVTAEAQAEPKEHSAKPIPIHKSK